MDEARIWNRVLSESEIKEAMDGELLSVASQDLLATMWGNVKVR